MPEPVLLKAAVKGITFLKKTNPTLAYYLNATNSALLTSPEAPEVSKAEC